MSTPMYDIPEHQMIPVNEDGQGPCDQSDTRAFRCWCGTDCGLVEHVTDDNGTPVCQDPDLDLDPLAVMEVEVRPVVGFCGTCHAYAMALVHALAEDES